MKNQEKKLANLFQQLGNRSETLEKPDTKLKDAVFSTIDATGLIADIVDLFTFQFMKTQTEVIDVFPTIYKNQPPAAVHEHKASEQDKEKEAFFKSLAQKIKKDSSE